MAECQLERQQLIRDNSGLFMRFGEDLVIGSNRMDDAALKSQLHIARDLRRAGHTQLAEEAYQRIQEARPDCVEAAISLARLTMQRGDVPLAEARLSAALTANPGQELLAVELAVVCAGSNRLSEATQVLRSHLDRAPASPFAWLLLGQMLEDLGRHHEALLARFEAVTRAHSAGLWRDPASTPGHLVDQVAHAIELVREHRREVFFAVIESIRAEHGTDELKRVDRALTGYLRDWDATPPDPMQRPRFFYFPDLPPLPFMDPYLQPWAPELQAAFVDIREEARSVIQERHDLEAFVKVKEDDRVGNYLGGIKPSWEAFFFYRHGERYDENHRRCPRTSAVLESLDLIRIPGQTPEICFSVLAPGTHILPHHGVTNTRAVMHLPLIVPDQCALNLVERGSHHWTEGELVMFDDTFRHEAWNWSDSPRIILLMDCWNPYLTPVERLAIDRIAQTIGALDKALNFSAWSSTK